MATMLMSCTEVRRELSNYIDEDVTPELRARIDNHLDRCRDCKAVYDGVRNVVRLVGDSGFIELPAGFSKRLYRRLSAEQSE